MCEEIFIIHSSKNADIANELKQYLEAQGATAFVANASVEPGTKWSPSVIQKLRESKQVILVASKDSRESSYVNQEIGGTVVMNKPLTPILCDISPNELPGWSQEFQAVNLTDDRKAVRGSLDKIGGWFALGPCFGVARVIGANLACVLIGWQETGRFLTASVSTPIILRSSPPEKIINEFSHLPVWHQCKT